jgi:hypothetical protein
LFFADAAAYVVNVLTHQRDLLRQGLIIRGSPTVDLGDIKDRVGIKGEHDVKGRPAGDLAANPIETGS